MKIIVKLHPKCLTSYLYSFSPTSYIVLPLNLTDSYIAEVSFDSFNYKIELPIILLVKLQMPDYMITSTLCVCSHVCVCVYTYRQYH